MDAGTPGRWNSSAPFQQGPERNCKQNRSKKEEINDDWDVWDMLWEEIRFVQGLGVRNIF